MALSKTTNTSGTSFTDHIIIASVNELTKALGEPHWAGDDEDEKTQYEWDFKIKREGSVFTIYDWKEYRRYSKDEKIEWHIGGFSSWGSVFNNSNGHTDMMKVIEELKKLGLDVR